MRRLRFAALLVTALAPATLPAGTEAQPAPVRPEIEVVHDLDIDFDPRARTLRVADVVELRGTGPVEVALGAAYRIEQALVDGRPLGAGRLRGSLRVFDLQLSGTHRLHLRYAGEVAPLIDTDHRGTLGVLEPMAAAHGSYLPAGTGWYPIVGDVPVRYHLALRLPPGQRGLVAGRQVEEFDTPDGYRAVYAFDVPTQGIELMAGPYTVSSRDVEVMSKQVRLRTWFHAEIAELAPAYLDATAAYVQMYSARLGAYPFDTFGVVSSPLPTGFGMPTLTYLGVDVLKLPFIRATSLGHEVLHNWWGNGVHVDYASGNWAEGLTTFMADYAYKEAEGTEASRAMRLDWLRDFAAIPPDQDTPLRSFTSRTHGMSQIVGYNKAAFVFYMLRAQIGESAFDRGLQQFWKRHRFRRAGWDDLRAAFEQASGADLRGFFAQWLDRNGAPRIRIDHAQRMSEDLHLTLSQGTPPFALDVPVTVVLDSTSRHEVLRLSQSRQSFVLRDAGSAQWVALDPDLRIFRLLDSAELPPILRNVMIDRTTSLQVVSEDAAFRHAARELAGALSDHAPTERAEKGPRILVVPMDIVGQTLRERGLPAMPPELAAPGSAKVWTVKDADAATTLVIAARDAQSVAALRRGLPHYGKQSWLVFDGARAVARGTWPVQAHRIAISD